MTDIGELISYHSKACNRLTNGRCVTLRCLVRGDAMKVADPQKATCEEYETVVLLRTLLETTINKAWKPT